jgi:hypothetical protein
MKRQRGAHEHSHAERCQYRSLNRLAARVETRTMIEGPLYTQVLIEEHWASIKLHDGDKASEKAKDRLYESIVPRKAMPAKGSSLERNLTWS